MFFELIEDTLELSIIIICLYFIIFIYVGKQYPTLSKPLKKRRFSIALGLVLIVTAMKISEDVLSAESSVFDKEVILYIHTHIPSSFTGTFKLITNTASLKVLLPLTIILSLLFLYTKRRFEAILLTSSVVSAALIVYIVKTLVNRSRPELWQTDWYWGSSFPSGHTLLVSAFATALALCIGRIWPKRQKPALIFAMIWLSLVAFSRLVLGVHWPTDVLAAICIGIFLPLVINMINEAIDSTAKQI